MTLALNKTTLKQQRDQASLYRRFLPSLELKRQQLQIAWRNAQNEWEQLRMEASRLADDLEPLYALMGGSTIDLSEMSSWVRIERLDVQSENIVGTKVPRLAELELRIDDYSRLVMPFWVDSLVTALQRMIELRVRQRIAKEKVETLDAALRRVTQRVNLFDKVLIPRAEANIRRITIFLSDQERAAVVRSKIAKSR